VGISSIYNIVSMGKSVPRERSVQDGLLVIVSSHVGIY
jgi:hypothetical protein